MTQESRKLGQLGQVSQERTVEMEKPPQVLHLGVISGHGSVPFQTKERCKCIGRTNTDIYICDYDDADDDDNEIEKIDKLDKIG